MDLTDIYEKVMAVVAVASAVGILLALPLYLSQRRDLKRLMTWMEREPEASVENIRASELILDRAETEVRQLTGEMPAVEADQTPSEVAARVTSERPALERITQERAALAPHPRWRRFRDTITQPRWLIAIGVGALVLAVGGIFGSQLLLEDDDEPRREARIDPSDTSVTVLNGTTSSGLGGKVGQDVKSNEFSLKTVGTYPEAVEQTVVYYERGSEGAARRLSTSLGGSPVQPIDRQTQRLADGAEVVVIVGQDRVVPGQPRGN